MNTKQTGDTTWGSGTTDKTEMGVMSLTCYDLDRNVCNISSVESIILLLYYLYIIYYIILCIIYVNFYIVVHHILRKVS